MARSSGGMMTAQATTGPANGPRHTSSTPAMHGPSGRRSSRSMPLHRDRCRVPRATALLGGGACFRNDHAHLLLLDARGFAGEMTQVVEFRAAHAAAAQHFDL